jgi:hypothetical protein
MTESIESRDSVDLKSLRMPAPDARAGLMVADSASILKRFYLIQRELALMQAGWLPGTDHWQSKLLLPECLWQDALVAEELRRRVLELRFPRREIIEGNDASIVQLLRQFRNAPHGVAFVEALRLVLKPLLRTAYRSYLNRIDLLDDAPTVRILRHAIADIQEQVERWAIAARDALKAYPERHAATKQWMVGARSMAKAMGNLLGPSLCDSVMPNVAEFGGIEFAISRTGVRDRRFNLNRFAWPDNWIARSVQVLGCSYKCGRVFII